MSLRYILIDLDETLYPASSGLPRLTEEEAGRLSRRRRAMCVQRRNPRLTARRSAVHHQSMRRTKSAQDDQARIDWDSVFSTLRSALAEREGDGRAAERSGEPGERPGPPACLPDPFRVLVSTVISLRTRDDVTSRAAGRLLARARSASDLARMPEREISELIYPAGFYRNKARHLRSIGRILTEEHGGRVPSAMEDLLALPGVGRKTANLVRGRGFGLPAICVDTHVHRIPNRLGWVSTKTPEQTERSLERILPERYWIEINRLLVRFGQQVCTPVSPRCSICPLSATCPRIGVDRSR